MAKFRYKITTPRYHNKALYGPGTGRDYIDYDKPFPKGKEPEGLVPVKTPTEKELKEEAKKDAEKKKDDEAKAAEDKKEKDAVTFTESPKSTVESL